MAIAITPASDLAISQQNQNRVRPATDSPAENTPRNTDDSVELSIGAENLTASRSRVADTDRVQEILSALQATVTGQAGTALQAQANIRPESALTLLKG